jgi:elongation factor Ts
MDNKKLVELVKKLRIEMGLGMMEIKAALEEAEGDEKKAKEILKEKGYQKAEKKAERETHQGRVATYTHATGKIGVMVELFCETDFVARNEEYLALTKDLCLQVAAMNPESPEDLLKQDFIKDPTKKVSDLIKGLVAKFGENIKLGRIARFEI